MLKLADIGKCHSCHSPATHAFADKGDCLDVVLSCAEHADKTGERYPGNQRMRIRRLLRWQKDRIAMEMLQAAGMNQAAEELASVRMPTQMNTLV